MFGTQLGLRRSHLCLLILNSESETRSVLFSERWFSKIKTKVQNISTVWRKKFFRILRRLSRESQMAVLTPQLMSTKSQRKSMLTIPERQCTILKAGRVSRRVCVFCRTSSRLLEIDFMISTLIECWSALRKVSIISIGLCERSPTSWLAPSSSHHPRYSRMRASPLSKVKGTRQHLESFAKNLCQLFPKALAITGLKSGMQHRRLCDHTIWFPRMIRL